MNQEFRDAQAAAEAALALLTSAQADEIIGEAGEEYGVLIRGTQGTYHMLWSMVKGNGLQEKPAVLRMGAQALTVLLTLVHYAYALGVKAGQGMVPPPAPPDGGRG